MDKYRILIIIPAYNEQDNILHVVNSLGTSDIPVDYVVINDCSTDSTREILNQNNINYVDLPVNLGIGGAVQTGYLYAEQEKYDIAIQLDGDGQHDPKYIKVLVDGLLDNDADIAIGSRFIENEGFQSTFMRRVGIKFLSRLIQIVSGTRILDVTSGFRAANARAIHIFAREYAQDYPEPEAIIYSARSNLKTVEVPVVMKERNAGESSISGFASVYYMIKVSLAILICGLKRKQK